MGLSEVVFLEFVVEGTAGDAEAGGEIRRTDPAVEEAAEHVAFALFDGFAESQGAVEEGFDGLFRDGQRRFVGRGIRTRTVEPGGQVSLFNSLAAFLKDEDLPNKVFQFANVAGANAPLDNVVNRRVHGGDFFGIIMAVFVEKGFEEEGDVFEPFAKRGDRQMDDVQPLVQVESELMVGDHLFEVSVCGRDDADVHFIFPVTANGENFSFLQNPQNLWLKGEGQFRDFIKEDGSAIRGAEIPLTIFGGPGEGAFHVAKKLAFGERACDGGAVDTDEGIFGPFFILLVNKFSNPLFSGAGFPKNNDRGVGNAGGAGGLPQDLPKSLADADDARGGAVKRSVEFNLPC